MTKPSKLTLTMTPPLMGFEDTTTYTLQPLPDNACFFTLEAQDGPSFILTKPHFFFPDYRVQVKQSDLANIKAEGTEPDVYLIVTVPEKVSDMSANLMAPLLVNAQKGLACQHVMHDSPYSTRHYLFPPEKRRHCG
ncbi:flagellar assembly protein FliW [Dethiobacter alkaliphilus]|uniref:Flagellar assembly factor FliW n=1 Tax=Dethiobacter alkaliphilus AHT 1 TaxID=555088 RepID=C0GJJ3_DETAL|nr:flagellar assembly protein FliW [Dethiobacter alkaliphilus]EEG76540.1 protein of unknown function DUF180 [Dethiobacter alkaliphilus AHT 1]